MNKNKNIEGFDFLAHSSRLEAIISSVYDELPLSEQDKADLKVAALVHDYGKLLVDKEHLFASPMNPVSWNEIKKHPSHGIALLRVTGISEKILDMTLYHHERFDGTGYPAGLKGDDIPDLAQILSIFDGFETAISGRFYQSPISNDDAVDSIWDYSGTKYNPRIVNMLTEVLDKLRVIKMKS